MREALHRYGRPEIFNTDQGCQFTSGEFTGLLKAHAIRISMDGKGSWRDNVFVERLWKTVKYEEVYLTAHDSVADAKANLAMYPRFDNEQRPHRSLDGKTPNAACFVAVASTTRPAAQDMRKGLRGFVDDALSRTGVACRAKVSRLFHRASLRPQAPPRSVRFA